jgi:hypothetical protein
MMDEKRFGGLAPGEGIYPDLGLRRWEKETCPDRLGGIDPGRDSFQAFAFSSRSHVRPCRSELPTGQRAGAGPAVLWPSDAPRQSLRWSGRMSQDQWGNSIGRNHPKRGWGQDAGAVVECGGAGLEGHQSWRVRYCMARGSPRVRGWRWVLEEDIRFGRGLGWTIGDGSC